VVIEDNGKVYQQMWAHCDFPKCKHRARCESNYGTTGTFRRYEKVTASPSEWAMAFKLFQCLKKFYDLTEIFSGTLYPTAKLFYRGGRVVDPFRSRLDPEMVQALICMKDWVAAGRRGEL